MAPTRPTYSHTGPDPPPTPNPPQPLPLTPSLPPWPVKKAPGRPSQNTCQTPPEIGAGYGTCPGPRANLRYCRKKHGYQDPRVPILVVDFAPLKCPPGGSPRCRLTTNMCSGCSQNEHEAWNRLHGSQCRNWHQHQKQLRIKHQTQIYAHVWSEKGQTS